MSDWNKFKYPKCPYCGYEVTNDNTNGYILSNLAIYGWKTQDKHRCHECGKEYMISVKIMYYSRKIKEVEHERPDR